MLIRCTGGPLPVDSDIFPIPRPYRPAGAIYHTDQPGMPTLQEQMHLEDDAETFSEIMARGDETALHHVRVTDIEMQGVMKKATSRRVDIRFPYNSQDPRHLEEIREEVGIPGPIENRIRDSYPRMDRSSPNGLPWKKYMTTRGPSPFT